VWKSPKNPHTLWKIGDISHFSLLFSKTGSTPTLCKNGNLKQRVWERDALPQQRYGSIWGEDQKTRILECPYGPKWKLQLIKGCLVWLPLCRTRHHRIDRLSLHFRATSTMMPHVPSTVAPSLVFRQNWETLARLALRWSKPPDVNVCPHTVFIRSLVLRCQPTNLPHLVLRPKPVNHLDDFEAQITKPSTLVLRPKPKNCRSGFEAKPLPNCRQRF
jgi:hypothetical protein